MKRFASLAAVCLLAACSESSNTVAPDLIPQFASTDGDRTWYFGGVVGDQSECTAAEGMQISGSVTFDDDAGPGIPLDLETRWLYHIRFQWHVDIGGVVQDSSYACVSGDCAPFTLLDGWFDEDYLRYWDGVQFSWPDHSLQIGTSNTTGEAMDYVVGPVIPADPPAAFSSEFAFPCPAPGGKVVKTPLVWVSLDPPAGPENPTTKADCMKGGWESYGFKNQGQCIRYVETGKDSR